MTFREFMTTETNVIERISEEVQIREPGKYNVLLHNDDTTTFDFVIAVLLTIFHKGMEEAIDITNHIHLNDKAIVGGPYTKEVAEEKVDETKMLANANGYPLTATFEET